MRMPGAIEITASSSLGKAIDDILLFVERGVDIDRSYQVMQKPCFQRMRDE
jgi:hypothetical protein